MATPQNLASARRQRTQPAYVAVSSRCLSSPEVLSRSRPNAQTAAANESASSSSPTTRKRLLATVLKRITPEVWRNVEQVVVFDDASQDSTFELAVGIQALTNLPKLKVLKHAKNLGYGGNQKAGYRYFIEQGFDIVVLLHGDGQYAPELLSHMYAPLVRGEADAVFGSRMMKDYGGPLKGRNAVLQVRGQPASYIL